MSENGSGRDGGFGALDADGDAGVGLVRLGDAGLGDSDGQVGGSGDAAVLGGSQGVGGGSSGGGETLGNRRSSGLVSGLHG
jgi:hypothetical protein